MSDDLQKRIFSNNLNNILVQKNKTQKEVADAIGVSTQTFNTWCRGIALPRMGKLQKLADYLLLNKSELLDAPPSPKSTDKPRLSEYAKQIGYAYDAADERTKTAVEVALGIDFEKTDLQQSSSLSPDQERELALENGQLTSSVEKDTKKTDALSA